MKHKATISDKDGNVIVSDVTVELSGVPEALTGTCRLFDGDRFKVDTGGPYKMVLDDGGTAEILIKRVEHGSAVNYELISFRVSGGVQR